MDEVHELIPIHAAAEEISRIIGRPLPPRVLTDVFYNHRVPDHLRVRYPRVTLVKRSTLPELIDALRAIGRLPKAPAAAEVASATAA